MYFVPNIIIHYWLRNINLSSFYCSILKNRGDRPVCPTLATLLDQDTTTEYCSTYFFLFWTMSFSRASTLLMTKVVGSVSISLRTSFFSTKSEWLWFFFQWQLIWHTKWPQSQGKLFWCKFYNLVRNKLKTLFDDYSREHWFFSVIARIMMCF